MSLFIYVLLLSIWTNNCLNTSQSNGSSTTGMSKFLESIETKIENFRGRLLAILIGVMMMSFVLICFCFLHYNCTHDDALKSRMFKKEGTTTQSLFGKPNTASPCCPENQHLLPNIDKLSRPLNSEKSSISFSAEKLTKSSSPERLSKQNNEEKLIKSLNTKKLSRPPCSKKLFRSSHLEKSHRTCNLEKSCKPAYAQKPVRQVNSSYPDKIVRPTCSLHPRNKVMPPKPLSHQKLAKPPRYSNVKRSVMLGRAVLLSRPQLAETCQCYKEKCLVCKTSSEHLIIDISKAKKKNARNLPVSKKEKYFSRSLYKVDTRNNGYYDNVSDSDMMTNDSDKEITIICNIRYNEVLSKGIPNN
ncbi:uncharacterized protein CXorf66 homolog [Carlito syrichta]|uniref:Uncharacterized protein CXorf66 homolog n=1 Tax=Carlito syrichta TaxID=1868482 RepID=A0A1U7TMQ0_CARSF|nr:uncharacterized protein CXorf66 homolog [Carlito syrichta]